MGSGHSNATILSSRGMLRLAKLLAEGTLMMICSVIILQLLNESDGGLVTGVSGENIGTCHISFIFSCLVACWRDYNWFCNSLLLFQIKFPYNYGAT
uniref:Uncharacterized protein n=1 Tax=Lotus japonicus TaxID=34305 RepID=I3T1U8_LOTJA|nr:unknown [Lotus japonicus]